MKIFNILPACYFNNYWALIICKSVFFKFLILPFSLVMNKKMFKNKFSSKAVNFIFMKDIRIHARNIFHGKSIERKFQNGSHILWVTWRIDTIWNCSDKGLELLIRRKNKNKIWLAEMYKQCAQPNSSFWLDLHRWYI